MVSNQVSLTRNMEGYFITLRRDYCRKWNPLAGKTRCTRVVKYKSLDDTLLDKQVRAICAVCIYDNIMAVATILRFHEQ